jgi:murein DD-endopeptidase MepM/ murein hydrolase activator NlpD
VTIEKIRQFLLGYLKAVFLVKQEAFSFVRGKLCPKKIVIISDSGIVNIPISFGLQCSFAAVIVFFMLWVSYSTSKYFSYYNILNKKDYEIWETSITNEDLQYQVSDLYRNLADVKEYFENVKGYDQLSSKELLSKDDEMLSFAGADALSHHSGEEVQGLFTNIRDKVIERISNLESIISMTGIEVEEMVSNNEFLKEKILSKRSSGEYSNQGGAFIPDKDNEFTQEVGYLLQLENVIHNFPIASPMKRFWVSSRYGRRVDPLRKRVAMHEGIDLVGPKNSKIYSSAPGIVIKAGRSGAYGNMVEIDHGFGVTTLYGHLSNVLVRSGQQINRGEVIGIQGTSGRSTGDHLHYEVRYNDETRDPKNFIKAGKYVF